MHLASLASLTQPNLINLGRGGGGWGREDCVYLKLAPEKPVKFFKMETQRVAPEKPVKIFQNKNPMGA